MALTTVLSVQVKPERWSEYEEAIQFLAERAVQEHEFVEWGAHTVAAGRLGAIHFVSEAANWKAFGERGSPEEMVCRVHGDQAGTTLSEHMRACAVETRFIIGEERSDLSRPPQERGRPAAMAAVALFGVRPGGVKAGETMFAKCAEAANKLKDPRHFITVQTVIGDLHSYWVVTPLTAPADLDQMRSPAKLLQDAFGEDGRQTFLSGLDAMQRAERQITVFRPDLSNFAWLAAEPRRSAHTRAPSHATH
jgi:hypothetical protein